MANAGEHTNSANSVPPATSPLAPNTYDAFSDTNNSDSTEQTVVIPKYGPVDSPGPSQKPYTAAHTSKFRSDHNQFESSQHLFISINRLTYIR
ncbi:hypothetical protein R6Q59_035635 [Mikania micrantha]